MKSHPTQDHRSARRGSVEVQTENEGDKQMSYLAVLIAIQFRGSQASGLLGLYE